jgi:hypothetical protein
VKTKLYTAGVALGVIGTLVLVFGHRTWGLNLEFWLLIIGLFVPAYLLIRENSN